MKKRIAKNFMQICEWPKHGTTEETMQMFIDQVQKAYPNKIKFLGFEKSSTRSCRGMIFSVHQNFYNKYNQYSERFI